MRYAVLALLLLSSSLVIGAIGYHYLAGLPWPEAYDSAVAVQFSFAPVPGAALLNGPGRLFGWFHALYSGIVLLTIAAGAIWALLHQWHSRRDPNG
jgi:hypothetical protein